MRPKAAPIPKTPPPLAPGQEPLRYGLGTHLTTEQVVKAMAKVYRQNAHMQPAVAKGTILVAKELGLTHRLRAELGLET